MEQIRIIKEMRDESVKQLRMRGSDYDRSMVKPRYMVWENVSGAFSSNKGEDFRAVLEETAKIADSNAVIPEPPKGKWTHAGCIMGDGWSIAWRVHDAQFWGVPQRRKRIALVADFGGESAPEILFERESLSGDTSQGGKEGQEVAGDIRAGIKKSSVCLGTYHCTAELKKVQTLKARDYKDPQIICFEPGSASRVGNHIYDDGKAGSLRAMPGDNHQAVVCLEGNGYRDSHKGDGYKESETMYTLNTVEQHAVCIENHPADSRIKISDNGIVQTLSGRMGTGGGNTPMVMEQKSLNGNDVSDTLVSSLGNASTGTTQDRLAVISTYQKTTGTLCERISAGTSNQIANNDMLVANTSIVRRLTPLECERLQGYPDHWTDIGDWVDSKGKKHKDESDSPRYKALGNSIALPFWAWMAKRMVSYLGDNPTMGSLFDGIGGFPLVYSEAGCIPIWASEIEEFPIAVTKLRFPE